MIIEFHKVRADAKTPSRSNPSDAGLDIFAHLGKLGDFVEVLPSQSVLIPTGLKFGVPHGYMLQVMNRSSVAAKRGLVVGAHASQCWLSQSGDLSRRQDCSVGYDSNCAIPCRRAARRCSLSPTNHNFR
jgi:hypothetical protein